MTKENVSSHLHSHSRRIAGRAQDPHIDDPYKRTEKLRAPSVCRQCAAVYDDGRWRWGARPADAVEVLCQACHRIHDRYPAGVVTLRGAYLEDGQHRTEILNLIHNQETAEQNEHPHSRIIAIEERKDEIVVTTTDIHLPRRIGDAVHRAFHGNIDLKYDKDSYFVRIDWQRDS